MIKPDPKLSPKPKQPTENQCCGNGCTPCVWDNYYAKLKKWRFEQAKIQGQQETK